MFTPGTLIYFTPFHFKNGNTPKPKYGIVLSNFHDNQGVMISLPTRRDNVPSKYDNQFGCIDKLEIGFNCFLIQKNVPVTDNGFSFPLKTHLYGTNLDSFDLNDCESTYPNEGSDYKIIGTLLPSVFDNILDCFKKSRVITQRLKRLLY